VVMHDDAHNVRQQAAAPGRDAIEGQPHGAGNVQPLRPAADPESSRCLTAAALTSAHTVSANPWARPAQVRLIRARVAATSRTGRPSPRPLGQKLVVQQVDHDRQEARAILHRGRDLSQRTLKSSHDGSIKSL
jgi:hypothetical protein